MRADVTELRAASRTDAGVHARSQLVGFDSDGVITPRGWALGLGARLPDDVSVRRACRVEEGFDPRFRSRGKRYAYRLLCDTLRDPFLDATHLRITRKLDVDAMKAEAHDAVGRHDFAAFRSAADHRENTVRELWRVDVERDQHDPRQLTVFVEGDGFLHNMVRILVGTIVQVGQGVRPRGIIARGLATRSREDLGKTAPAHGLMLEEVFVDERGHDEFPRA